METRYSCPHCGAHLNPLNEIILRAKVAERFGLVLLHPEPGNYQIVTGVGVAFEHGEIVELSCPACSTALTSKRDDPMAEVVFDAAGRRGIVVFSRVYGKHATYVVAEREVSAFGEDAERGALNFLGTGPGI